ncbi:MAG: hypothetical protein GY861_26630 [bacterium]|nr:hypothetical protein [bacterium]
MKHKKLAMLFILIVLFSLGSAAVVTSTFIPEKCWLQMGLNCKDNWIDADSNRIELMLENGMGQGILILDITATGTGDTNGVLCKADYTGIIWQDGKNGLHLNNGEDNSEIILDCSEGVPLDPSWSIEKKKKFNLELNWYANDSTSEFSHLMNGELKASVESKSEQQFREKRDEQKKKIVYSVAAILTVILIVGYVYYFRKKHS